MGFIAAIYGVLTLARLKASFITIERVPAVKAHTSLLCLCVLQSNHWWELRIRATGETLCKGGCFEMCLLWPKLLLDVAPQCQSAGVMGVTDHVKLGIQCFTCTLTCFCIMKFNWLSSGPFCLFSPSFLSVWPAAGMVPGVLFSSLSLLHRAVLGLFVESCVISTRSLSLIVRDGAVKSHHHQQQQQLPLQLVRRIITTTAAISVISPTVQTITGSRHVVPVMWSTVVSNYVVLYR